jgi:hypothetical protein
VLYTRRKKNNSGANANSGGFVNGIQYALEKSKMLRLLKFWRRFLTSPSIPELAVQ